MDVDEVVCAMTTITIIKYVIIKDQVSDWNGVCDNAINVGDVPVQPAPKLSQLLELRSCAVR